MRRMRRAFALALLLAAAPVASFANIVTYDFTVSGGPSGPLANVLSSGYFSYDDSRITPDNWFIGGVGTFVDFAFTWAGITYDESIAEPSLLTFSSTTGALRGFSMGNNCQMYTCTINPVKNDWFASFTTYSPDGQFLYGIGNQLFTGSVVNVALRGASVPEPGMLSLMLAGVAGIGLFARRQRRLVTSKQ